MKYKIKFVLSLCLLLSAFASSKADIAKEGIQIQVNAPKLKGKTMYLAMYENGQAYTIDSTNVAGNTFTAFQSSALLPEGQYLLYVKPDVQYPLLLGKSQGVITLNLNPDDPEKNTVVGSEDTQLLWNYIHTSKQMEDRVGKEADDAQDIISLYALEEANKHKGTWFSSFIKGYTPIYVPAAYQTDLTIYKSYLKEHFFDNIDLTDPRLWHTDYLTTYIDTYMNSVVDAVPDSMASAASILVSKTKNNPECFKAMLSRFIKQSQESNVMGQENIWARLFEDYIENKTISWIDDSTHANLQKAYDRIRYNRIGMQAQNLVLENIDGKSLNTNDVEATATLLYFYSPDCSYCKTETPKLHNEVYAKFKDKGFKVIAINIAPDAKMWKEMVDELKLKDWINCSDHNYKSQYWLYYDIYGTPAFYLLDKDKKIIGKKIDEDNLVKILNHIYGTN